MAKIFLTEPCSYKSPKKKRDIRLTSSLKQDPVEGAAGSWKVWKSVCGEAGGSECQKPNVHLGFAVASVLTSHPGLSA